jgi:hypothetical protein
MELSRHVSDQQANQVVPDMSNQDLDLQASLIVGR